VGIIMYLPTSDPVERALITDAFGRYKELCMDQLWGAYGACEHWAKVRPRTQ
jgi:L-galactono-1,4-lactone dehydrogenase